MRQAAAHAAAPVPSEAAVRDIIGLGLPEAMRELFPGLAEPERDALRERYSACYVALDREPAALFPGALAVMTTLRERGHQLAVATGKGRAGLDRVLRGHGLEGWFDGTRCADETRSKPHPQMVFELLEMHDCTAEQALVIGDSEYDLMMASAAAVRSVGVSYGVHAAERLGQHQPVTVVDNLPELLALELLS